MRNFALRPQSQTGDPCGSPVNCRRVGGADLTANGQLSLVLEYGPSGPRGRSPEEKSGSVVYEALFTERSELRFAGPAIAAHLAHLGIALVTSSARLEFVAARWIVAHVHFSCWLTLYLSSGARIT